MINVRRNPFTWHFPIHLNQEKTSISAPNQDFTSDVKIYLPNLSSFDQIKKPNGFSPAKVDTGERCKICSKLTIKIPERRHSDVFIVDFEHILLFSSVYNVNFEQVGVCLEAFYIVNSCLHCRKTPV